MIDSMLEAVDSAWLAVDIEDTSVGQMYIFRIAATS